MSAFLLIKDEATHQLKSVHEDLLQVDMLRIVLLVSDLLERDRLVGE